MLCIIAVALLVYNRYVSMRDYVRCEVSRLLIARCLSRSRKPMAKQITVGMQTPVVFADTAQ